MKRGAGTPKGDGLAHLRYEIAGELRILRDAGTAFQARYGRAGLIALLAAPAIIAVFAVIGGDVISTLIVDGLGLHVFH